METGVHKNEQGNWEMPLPFRRKDPHLPINEVKQSTAYMASLAP